VHGWKSHSKTVSTSECRRRLEGTGERVFRYCAISGFAHLEEREAFTFEARTAVDAPGLGGRIHDPDTLSSYRLPRARGPGTFRVPEPAPLRVRSRRGYRVRFEPRGISVKRGVRGSRTMVARAPRRGVRHARGPSVSFELGRACPKVDSFELPRASRPVMRPIDVCTPKPFQIEHSYFVVSQRDDPSRKKPFSTIPRVIHVPEPCGSVLVLAVVYSANRVARPKTRAACIRRLGAA